MSLLLALVLAVLWLLVALNHQKITQDAQTEHREQTSTIALAFAEHTESTFARVDYVLFQLRDAWVNQHAAFGDAIAEHLSLLGDAVLQVSVIDSRGMLSFSNLGGPRIDLSDREHFKVHAQGSHADRLFLSRPTKGRVSGKWSIQLTRPIFEQGRFAGVIVLSVDPGYFVRFYQKIDLGTQGSVMMVRDSGEIMARSIGMQETVGKVISTQLFTNPGAPQRGNFSGPSLADGVQRIHGYFRMADYGLTLVIGMGADEHLGPARLQQRTVLLLASGASVLLMGLFWLVLRGMARREQAEAALVLQAGSLTRANAELMRLGEVMAHHFQEPTRRLTSFAQRLLAKSALASDEDSRASLHFIDTESRRLSALVHDAQRYLALEHSKMGAAERADSAAALRQCIAAAGSAATQADMVLHEPLPWVRLTDETLRELFALLLDNALRYRHPQRPIRIEVSAYSKGERAVFRFADNGSGIAPEYRAQVLGLFTRLVPSSIPGTGMGLALAGKIVGLVGGQLHIEDGLEGGACIVFDLPLEPTP
jgi:signal transduction histidine kinase